MKKKKKGPKTGLVLKWSIFYIFLHHQWCNSKISFELTWEPGNEKLRRENLQPVHSQTMDFLDAGDSNYSVNPKMTAWVTLWKLTCVALHTHLILCFKTLNCIMPCCKRSWFSFMSWCCYTEIGSLELNKQHVKEWVFFNN